MAESNEILKASSDALPADHYRVNVTSAPLGTIPRLENKSSKGGVSHLYDGRKWTRHATRVKDEASGERIFWVANPPAYVKRDRESIIAWAESLKPIGYQVAIESEAAEFADAHPCAQRGGIYYILAYGSSAQLPGGRWCVAYLGAYVRARILYRSWVGRALSEYGCALLVRKASSTP